MVILILGSGCVYYNTFFHARQKFKEAEKSQRENTERLGQAQQTPGNPTGQRQPGGAPAQKQPGDQAPMKINAQERVLYDAAIDKAKKVLTNHPKSKWADDALWLIGKSYYNMGDYLIADRSFKQLATNFPKSKFADESYYYMGLCQIYLGHNDQALSAFASLQDAYKKSPFIEDMLFAQGAMEMISENYPQAAEVFAQYLEKYPGGDSSARAMYDLGLCHEKQGDFPGAFAAYSSVERYGPDRLLYFEATLSSATAALKSDSVDLGMRILDRLARDERYFTRSGEIRLRVAEGHYLRGDIDKAIEIYNDIISSNPRTNESAEAYYKLGLIQQNDKFDLAAAKDAFTKAQQEAPNSEFKNLALARSAQIAKLESYRAQLQRADSLKQVDEIIAMGGDPDWPAGLVASPDTAGLDTSASVASDSSQAAAVPSDSMAAQAPSPEGDTIAVGALIDSAMATVTGADTSSDAVLRDSAFRETEPYETLDDSLRVSRMMRMMDAKLPPDTMAQAAPGQMDTVFLGQQDTNSAAPPPVTEDLVATIPPAGQATVNEDSLRAAILQAGIETRYLLSELYAYELNRPDSAVHEYLLIVTEHPDSPYAPKSLLAAAQVELGRGDTTTAQQFLQRVIVEYPHSPQAARAAEILGSPFDLTGNALGLYAAAESLVYYGNNPDSALILFRHIAENYPDLAPKASYAVAWILDQIKGVEDSSAYHAYTLVAVKYPETAYAQAANERLGISSNQGARRTPPKPSKQPQDEQKPSSEDETESDSTQQLIAGDLPLAPRVKTMGEFLYPEALLSRELKGKVIFKLRLDISGMVRDYELIGPSGEHAIDSAATESLIRTEFDISELDLAQLDGYFQYSIAFKRPIINIYNDPYRERHEGGQ